MSDIKLFKRKEGIDTFYIIFDKSNGNAAEWYERMNQMSLCAGYSNFKHIEHGFDSWEEISIEDFLIAFSRRIVHTIDCKESALAIEHLLKNNGVLIGNEEWS